MDLQTLLERVKAAGGPDRELDAELWVALEPGATRKQWSYIHEASGRECHVDETRDATRRLIIVPSFTASIDAALALVERALPGRGYEIHQGIHETPMVRLIRPDESAPDEYDSASPPALAILAALLTALIAQKAEA